MKNVILTASVLIASAFGGIAFAADHTSSFPQSYGPYVGEMKSADAGCGHKGERACIVSMSDDHSDDKIGANAMNSGTNFAYGMSK